jgi:hypothetical protein
VSDDELAGVEAVASLAKRLTDYAATLNDRERAILLAMADHFGDPVDRVGRRDAASLLDADQQRVLEELVAEFGS